MGVQGAQCYLCHIIYSLYPQIHNSSPLYNTVLPAPQTYHPPFITLLSLHPQTHHKSYMTPCITLCLLHPQTAHVPTPAESGDAVSTLGDKTWGAESTLINMCGCYVLGCSEYSVLYRCVEFGGVIYGSDESGGAGSTVFYMRDDESRDAKGTSLYMGVQKAHLNMGELCLGVLGVQCYIWV